MHRRPLLLTLVSVILFLFSCQKRDIKQTNSLNNSKKNSESFLQVIKAMELMRDTSSNKLAIKIDTLLNYLSDESSFLISLKEDINVIVYDLKKYKNPSLPQYKNTYYKVYFPIKNGIIEGGAVYTIHTDWTKADIDAEFENIFLQKSNTFTGTIVVNYFNDQFVQGLVFEKGGIFKHYSLDASNGNNSPSNIVSENSKTTSDATNCISYYLVTTTYWSDGTSEKDWLYLYTICGDCIPTGQPVSTIVPDCDGDSGGGGNGSVEYETEEVEEVEFEEFDATEIESNTSCQSKMHYNVYKRKVGGITLAVTASPAYCSNPIIDYCTYKNKQIKKRTQVGIHTPVITPLILSWQISWNYTNFFTYTFYDGSPTETGSRYNSVSKTVK